MIHSFVSSIPLGLFQRLKLYLINTRSEGVIAKFPEVTTNLR